MNHLKPPAASPEDNDPKKKKKKKENENEYKIDFSNFKVPEVPQVPEEEIHFDIPPSMNLDLSDEDIEMQETSKMELNVVDLPEVPATPSEDVSDLPSFLLTDENKSAVIKEGEDFYVEREEGAPPAQTPETISKKAPRKKKRRRNGEKNGRKRKSLEKNGTNTRSIGILNEYGLPFKPKFASSPEPLSRPIKYGNFVATHKLGAGNMGSVYLARHMTLGNQCVIKTVLRTAQSAGDDNRFMREAQITANLKHPGIVKVYECGTKPERYFVMDFIEGIDLKEILKVLQDKNRHLADLTAVTWLLQICEGLDYMHKKGVIHRDIKPANLMLSKKTKQPIICDLGLAKALGEKEEDIPMESQVVNNIQDNANLTQTGNILGTIAYASPEQAMGNISRMDGRTDIYSLGASFYEMLTGTTPYTGTVMNLLYQVADDKVEPPPLSELAPQSHPDLIAIIEKMMNKKLNSRNKSKERYRKVEHIIEDLKELQEKILKGPVQYFIKKHPYLTFGSVGGISTLIILLIATVLSQMDKDNNKPQNPQDTVKQVKLSWEQESKKKQEEAQKHVEQAQSIIPATAKHEELVLRRDALLKALLLYQEAEKFNPKLKNEKENVAVELQYTRGMIAIRNVQAINNAEKRTELGIKPWIRRIKSLLGEAIKEFQDAIDRYPDAANKHFLLKWTLAYAHRETENVLQTEGNYIISQRNNYIQQYRRSKSPELLSKIRKLGTQMESIFAERGKVINTAITKFKDTGSYINNPENKVPGRYKVSRFEQLAQLYHREAILECVSTNGRNVNEAKQALASSLKHYDNAESAFDSISPSEKKTFGSKSDIQSNKAYALGGFAQTLSAYYKTPEEYEIEIKPYVIDARKTWEDAIFQRAKESKSSGKDVPSHYWQDYLNALKTPKAQRKATLERVLRMNPNDRLAKRLLDEINQGS